MSLRVVGSHKMRLYVAVQLLFALLCIFIIIDLTPSVHAIKIPGYLGVEISGNT